MLAVGKFVCDCFGKGIPEQIVKIIRLVYNGIRIGVPIILILVGMFDMGKAITMQKEDDIKKAQQLLARKAVAAALVFLIISVVGLIITAVDKTATDEMGCVNCILFGDLETTKTSTKPSTPSFTQVSSINFTSSIVELKVGETKEVYLIINPNNATNKSITFLSYADNVASFKEEQTSNGVKVTIKGEGLGIGSYTAVSTSNQSLKASLTIRVSNEPGLTINKDVVYVAKGKSEKLTASLSGTSWTSNSPSVASVDSSGKVTAKATGTTTIVAHSKDKTATVTVHVVDIDISSTKTSIKVNESGKLSATVIGDTGLTTKWTTLSGSEFLSVDQEGNIKGQKVGTAKVKVSLNSADGVEVASKEVSVKVTEKVKKEVEAVIRQNVIIKGNSTVVSLSNVTSEAMCSGFTITKDYDYFMTEAHFDPRDNNYPCNISVKGLKATTSRELTLGKGTDNEIKVNKPITILPDFLGKYVSTTSTSMYANNMYIHLLPGDIRSIACQSCSITKISDSELKIIVDGNMRFTAQISNVNQLKFVDSSKEIKVQGLSTGSGSIHIKSNDFSSGLDEFIYYTVYSKNKSDGSAICYADTISTAENLVPLRYNEVSYHAEGSSRSAISFLFWGNENITLEFEIAASARKRLGDFKCSNLVVDMQVQVPTTNENKIPGLYRFKLDGSNGDYCRGTIVKGLGGDCGNNPKAYTETLKVYYIKK